MLKKSKITVQLTWLMLVLTVLFGCSSPEKTSEPAASQEESLQQGKPVVYQVFTRLFGNKKSRNKPWGTLTENGVGKFSDFTDAALVGIKELGTTHIWYTGVPHHAVIGDYQAYGISQDDPDVVKGRAGSPYAVKDYYNVNPDLADDPAQRLEEFKALIDRTHQHGMRVIIDIVPNHVARNYQSISKPNEVEDFGARDNQQVEYARDNNFYYVPNQAFQVPYHPAGYQPLGGDTHPLADDKFIEYPAKWTGNGARLAQPDSNDWYETVKVNFGVKPDGNYDFDQLPDNYRHKPSAEHQLFWANKDVPDSWRKFKHIVHYWLDLGVDGFRYDMAEMVPVEFWSYLNSSIKTRKPKAFLLAEVYQPHLYRDYIQLGKMDYLYDKVEFYDSLKLVMQGKGNTDQLEAIQQNLTDIEQHMLHFLENHDEQRIASPEFAGDAQKGKPALVASALISRSPTLLYFGQEVGEDGSEDAGFGQPSRTSIFDYIGVPAHQRWMNKGKFDGGQLTDKEKALRDFYRRILTLSRDSSAVAGHYLSVHGFNQQHSQGYDHQLLSFVRWSDIEKLWVISNFSGTTSKTMSLQLSPEAIDALALNDGVYQMTDLLSSQHTKLRVLDGQAKVDISLAPLQSIIWRVP